MRPIHRTGTALPSKHPILYIFSTNIRTEFFKHAAHSQLFLPLQNAVYFTMLPFFVPVLFTFTYRVCENLNAKFRCQKVKSQPIPEAARSKAPAAARFLALPVRIQNGAMMSLASVVCFQV
jgi:hypothetical protein